MKRVFICSSAEETHELGKRFSAFLGKQSAVLLSGELGAGKTVFVKGLAEGLKISAPVKSPTFTIVREYPGEIPLYHFDLYRITGEDELFETGFESYLGRGVCAVEWPEAARGVLTGEITEVNIEYCGDNRLVSIAAPFDWSV